MTLQAKLDAFKVDFEAGKPSGPRAAGRLGHMPRPEEIAAAMLFLASEDSSFVAGSELLVDGGGPSCSRPDTGRPTLKEGTPRCRNLKERSPSSRAAAAG